MVLLEQQSTIVVNGVWDSIRLLRKLNKHGKVLYTVTVIVVKIDPRTLGGLVKKKKNVKVVDSVVVLPQLF